MDIVYIVKTGDSNEELRYSLRSLMNYGHHKVWVVGYTPKLVDNVNSIPVQQTRQKYANTARNILVACQYPEVSKEFVLMNDDFFIMEKVDDIPVFNRGTLSHQIGAHIVRHGETSYSRGAELTRDLLVEAGYKDPLSFSLHVPMVIDKALMESVIHEYSVIDIAQTPGVPAYHLRSLYGNIAGLSGETVPDPKITGLTRKDFEAKEGTFISTNDRSFRQGWVGKAIRGKFRTAGDYEKVRNASRQPFVHKRIHL